VLIVLLLHRESLKLILVDEPLPEVVLSHEGVVEEVVLPREQHFHFPRQFLWETSDVISEGIIRLLSTALRIPEVNRTHVRALEFAGEDLTEVIQTMDDVSWQMIQPGPGRIS
jgi:hypothetical protein